MADAAEQLVVSLEARIRDFERNFQKASGVANDNWRKIEQRGEQGARRLDISFASATKSVGERFRLMASTAAGAMGAAFGLNEIKKLSDEWTAARSKIAAAGEEITNVENRQRQLADLAIKSRGDFSAIVDLYTGLARSTKEMGASQEQVLRATELISKAFATSGTTGEAAKGSILQLNQALAAGALRGDELNSILEGAPPIARLIAKEFGVSIGQLKALGEQGKLTSDRVFGAILKGAPTIEAEFAKTAPTISQSIQAITTALTRYIGEVDQASGFSSTLSGALLGVANNMNSAAPALVAFAAGLTGLRMGGPIVGGIAAATVALAGFSGQIHPIAGELASLADYARVAWSLIKEGAGDAAAYFQAAFARAANYVTQALASINAGDALSNLLAGVKAVANATIGAFVAAGHAIVGAWDATGLAITNSIVAAMNAVIAAVENAANRVTASVNQITGALNKSIGASFPTIEPMQFDRLTGTSRTAGAAVAKAFADGASAMKRDYIGEIGDQLNKVRDKANSTAVNRVFDHPAPTGDTGGGVLKPMATGKTGTKKTKTENEYQRQILEIERQTRSYEMETQTISLETREVEKARVAFDLFESAKKADISVTEQMRQKVNGLADAYATAKTALDEAQKRQENFKETAGELASTLSDAFKGAALQGEKLSSVLDRMAQKLAGAAIDKIITIMLTGQSGTGGLIGAGAKAMGFAKGGFVQGDRTAAPLTPAVLSAPMRFATGGHVERPANAGGYVGAFIARYATGGYVAAESVAPPALDRIEHYATGGAITGPGTGTSDSIPALLSNGEYIINAKATSEHRTLLESINSGKLSKFATGGLVGASPSLPGVLRLADGGAVTAPKLAAPGTNYMGGNTSVAPTINVAVEGGSKGPEADAALAHAIGRQVEQTVRGLVVSELRAQMRPGNILSRHS